ncbi:MAG: hypothetical protein ACU84Q_17710 [Gammaproteobacteria bacterium]
MIKNADAGYTEVQDLTVSIANAEIVPLLFSLFTLVFTMTALRYEWVALLWVPTLIWFLLIPMADRWFEKRTNRSLHDKQNDIPVTTQHKEVVLSGLLSIAALLILSLTGHRTSAELLALGVNSGFLVFMTLMASTSIGTSRHKLLWTIASALLRGIGFAPQCSEPSRTLRQKLAATTDDSASARMGENYYFFLKRYIRGVVLCRDRLAPRSNEHIPAQGLLREFWQTTAVFIFCACFLVYFGGPQMLIFVAALVVIVVWQTSAFDYTRRYGLLRQRTENGDLEPEGAHHRWRFNNCLNAALLGAKDDMHHAVKADRRLANEPCGDLQLKFGANLISLVVLSPKTWFRLVNAKLAVSADNDLRKVNLDGKAYVELMEAFHRVE